MSKIREPNSKIRELNTDEIAMVSGGMSAFAWNVIYVGIGIAAIAAAPELGLGAVAAIGFRAAGGVLVSGGTFGLNH
jgi:hypothetical protein